MIKLRNSAARIVASYLRAFVGSAVAVAQLDTLSEVRGVVIAAALATIPAVLRAVEALAADIDPDA